MYLESDGATVQSTSQNFSTEKKWTSNTSTGTNATYTDHYSTVHTLANSTHLNDLSPSKKLDSSTQDQLLSTDNYFTSQSSLETTLKHDITTEKNWTKDCCTTSSNLSQNLTYYLNTSGHYFILL